MSRVVVTDPALPELLMQAIGPVQLVNKAGRVIGEFAPAYDFGDISEEALDRQERESQRWYTTQEVLDHLRKLK